MKNQKDNLIYDSRLGEQVYLINSSSVDSDLEYINLNEIKNIRYICNNKDDRKDVGFLSDIHHEIDSFQCITLFSGSFDFSGLNLCKSLKDLYLGNNCKGDIELSSFFNLTSLYCENFTHVRSMPSESSLEEMTLIKVHEVQQDESFFGVHPFLRTFSISNSKVLNGLTFLNKSPLKTLWVYSCKFIDFKLLSAFPLLELRIEKCKHVASEFEVFKVVSLEWLTISDSFTLSSAKDLDSLVNLRTLIVLGKSYFEDGKLASLKARLEIFNFDNKRHYDIKWSQANTK